MNVVALCGGIGGVKLALGLYQVLAPNQLTVITNTGDDFEHLGLHVAPDTDTVMYTLAGISNQELGWGRDNESWHFMEALTELGGENWFQLGDRDLATSVLRTAALAGGKTLSGITRELTERLHIHAHLIPMSDDRVRTVVNTVNDRLPFQAYFVRDRCSHVVTGFTFDGADSARPSEAAIQALQNPELTAVIICPSNPYISIDPILAVEGYRQAIRNTTAPVVAVSPVIGTDSIKGPTAKIMRELNVSVSPASIAAHYAGLLDGFVVDETDRLIAEEIDVPVLGAQILMKTLEHKTSLARETLDFAQRICSV